MPVTGRNFLTFLDLKGQTQPLSQFTGKPVQDDLFMDKDDDDVSFNIKKKVLDRSNIFLNVPLQIYYKNKEPAPAGDFFYYRGSFSGTFLGKVVGFSKKKLLRGFSLLGHIFSASKTFGFC